MPHDDDAERAVLGALMSGAAPEDIKHAVSMLEAGDFYLNVHRLVYEAVVAVHARGDAPDAVLVQDAMRSQGTLEHLTGGGLYLIGLTSVDAAPSVAALRRYAAVVKDQSRRRAVVEAGGELMASARVGGDYSLSLTRLNDLAAEDAEDVRTALDWSAILAAGVPESAYLLEPYLPDGARVWAWGPAESGKSMWALWASAELTRRGHSVLYMSQENPLQEEVRRVLRIGPAFDRLRFFHDAGIDLVEPADVRWLIDQARGASLVVLDTLTACWSGDENDNAAVAAFDRDVLAPLVRDTGATVLVIDHTGHPQMFVRRRGASAGRGGSAKGQKADVVLEFKPKGDSTFEIHHGKNRMGGRKEPDRVFAIADTEDDGLTIVGTELSVNAAAKSIADDMVLAIEGAARSFLTTKELRGAVVGGNDAKTAAIALLNEEEPPRVRGKWEYIPTEGGRQRAFVWRPIGDD